jgi:hypothetical protein
MIRNIHYSNFHSCLGYGIILWDRDNENNTIYKLQKKVLQIFSGVSNHVTYRQIFLDCNVFFIRIRSDMLYEKNTIQI